MNDGRFGGTGYLHERPTLDVVVLLLAVVVAFVFIASATAVVVLEVVNPDSDTSTFVALLDSHIGTIVGALLGLIAGQATVRDSGPSTFR